MFSFFLYYMFDHFSIPLNHVMADEGLLRTDSPCLHVLAENHPVEHLLVAYR